MANGFNVAVAGATGAVGVEMIKTLEKRNFPVKNLKLLASARSAGKTATFKGETIKIEEMTEESFKGVDIALFSAGGDISKQFRPDDRRAERQGTQAHRRRDLSGRQRRRRQGHG